MAIPAGGGAWDHPAVAAAASRIRPRGRGPITGRAHPPPLLPAHASGGYPVRGGTGFRKMAFPLRKGRRGGGSTGPPRPRLARTGVNTEQSRIYRHEGGVHDFWNTTPACAWARLRRGRGGAGMNSVSRPPCIRRAWRRASRFWRAHRARPGFPPAWMGAAGRPFWSRSTQQSTHPAGDRARTPSASARW